MTSHRSDYRTRLIQACLRKAGPDNLHRVGAGWNWDFGTDVLQRIVEHPQCDRATALEICWRGAPDDFWASTPDLAAQDCGDSALKDCGDSTLNPASLPYVPVFVITPV